MSGRSFWALVAVAGFALVLGAGESGASYPGANGRIAFATTGGAHVGLGQIYAVGADGQRRVRVSRSEASDFNPVVSPDGKWIALVRGPEDGARRSLAIVDASGGSSHVIRTACQLQAPSWSPDSSRVAFVGLLCGIDLENAMFVMRADGSGVHRIAEPSEFFTTPRWSPDGTRIAYVAPEDVGVGDVAVVNADGSDRRLLAPDGENPSWSPDGSRIVYTASPYDVLVVNADGTGGRLLASGGLNPAWSPDGSRIAFAIADEESSRIAVMNADGSGTRVLATAPGDSLEAPDPVWSPDGSRLAFVRHEEGVAVMDADGSHERRLGPSSGWAPVWSKDGSRLAFVGSTPEPRGAPYESSGKVYVASADGTGLRVVATQQFGYIPTVSWRPDGRLVFSAVAKGNDFDIRTIRPDGSGMETLTRSALDDVQPAWSPNGRAIAFVRGKRDVDSDNFHWYSEIDGSIYVMDAHGNGVKRLTRGRHDAHPAWSPDAKTIAFDRNDWIYVVGADGRGLRRLARGTEPAFAPDGRIATVRYPDVFVIDAAGRGARRITPRFVEEGNDSDIPDSNSPDWSPTGTQVVFVRAFLDRTLWTVDASGKNLHALRIRGAGAYPAWSPDGKSIAYIDDRTSAVSVATLSRRSARAIVNPGDLVRDLSWQRLK